MFVSTIQYFCIAFIISTANCADKRIAQVKYSELLKLSTANCADKRI